MTSGNFGVYAMTYLGGLNLSTVLVQSVPTVSPSLPIMTILGERFDLKDHPLDAPVMPAPQMGFWAEIEHQNKDFFAEEGPFVTPFYIDADTIVESSPDSPANRVAEQEGDFICVQPMTRDDEWHTVIE